MGTFRIQAGDKVILNKDGYQLAQEQLKGNARRNPIMHIVLDPFFVYTVKEVKEQTEKDFDGENFVDYIIVLDELDVEGLMDSEIDLVNIHNNLEQAV